jgi:site-specific recombinase XerD
LAAFEVITEAIEERRAKQFLDHLKRCRCREDRPPLKPRRQKYSLHLFFQFLQRAGIVTNPTVTESVLESPVLASFCEWMRRQRGATDATLSIYRFELRAFICVAQESAFGRSIYKKEHLRNPHVS